MNTWIHATVFAYVLVYGTLCIALGLVFSALMHRHAARAHQILLLCLVASLTVPGVGLLVKHLEWGLIEIPEVSAGIALPLDTSASPTRVAMSIPSTENRTAEDSFSLPWYSLLQLVWLTASLILVFRLIRSFRRGHQACKQALPVVEPTITQAAKQAKARLSLDCSLRLVSVPSIRSPQIWCWSPTPTMMIPRWETDEMLPINWFMVFCHELAHLRRRDHISGLLAELMLCLIPWHPLIWLAKRRLIQLSERACDDWVLAEGQSSAVYAESLLHLAAQAQPVIIPTMASNQQGLANRIERILHERWGNPRISRRWGTLVCALITLCGLGIAFAQTRSVTSSDTSEATTFETHDPHEKIAETNGPAEEVIPKKQPDEDNAEYVTRLRAEAQAMMASREIMVERRPGQPEYAYQQHVRMMHKTRNSMIALLDRQSNESETAYQERLLAVYKFIKSTKQRRGESNLSYEVRMRAGLSRLTRTQPSSTAKIERRPGESEAGYQARRRGADQDAGTSSEVIVKQRPGQSNAAFRAKMRAATATVARNSRKPIDTDIERLSNAKYQARIRTVEQAISPTAKRPNESDKAYEQRLQGIGRALAVAEPSPNESLASYCNRLAAAVDVFESGAWKEPFNRAYRLEAGQNLKRMAPPFIAERACFSARRTHPSQLSLFTLQVGCIILRQEGLTMRPRSTHMGLDTYSLGFVLNNVLQLHDSEFEGPLDLLDTPLKGDWVIREGISTADSLKALRQILVDELTLNLQFEKHSVNRLHVVFRGRPTFVPLQAAEQHDYVHVFADAVDDEGELDIRTSKRLDHFLHQLTHLLGMPMANESGITDLPRTIDAQYHRSSHLYRTKDLSERRRKVDLLLQNLRKQIGMEITTEQRPVEIWRITRS